MLWRTAFCTVRAVVNPMGHAFNGVLRGARPTAAPLVRRWLSNQDQLPRLPVPALQQTMDKFLRTVRPIVNDDEFKHAQKLVASFTQTGGIGERLQGLLQQRADTTLNWLEQWWLDKAYLEYRLPCPINVSPGVALPAQVFSSIDDQLRFAAKLIAGVIDYKVKLDKKTLPVDYMGREPLCMNQYFQILCSCRVPGPERDSLVHFLPDQPDSPKHIVVIHNNHFFSLDTYDSHWKPMSVGQLFDQLSQIVKLSLTPAPPIGILTSDHRDNWAEASKILLSDSRNRDVVETIEKSILVVCLDNAMPGSVADRPSQILQQMNYGGGSGCNSANRWFDKTLQLVVSADGAVGLTYEHCAAEGPPVISLVDHAFSYTQQEQSEKPASETPSPVALPFSVSPALQTAMTDAARRLDTMANDMELIAYKFSPFGKGFLKSQKLSPDAFIQVSLQLAYFRLHHEPTATYESGSLRRYLHGRTDTIRSCSVAALQYCQAMTGGASPSERGRRLREAITAHSQYSSDVVNGEGIDRHLLGLRLIAEENQLQVPQLFQDPLFAAAQYWKLSTSQVPSKHAAVLSFGAVVNDGYGMCYNPQADDIHFSFSAWNSCADTSARRLADSMHAALADGHDVLLQTPAAKL